MTVWQKKCIFSLCPPRVCWEFTGWASLSLSVLFSEGAVSIVRGATKASFSREETERLRRLHKICRWLFISTSFQLPLSSSALSCTPEKGTSNASTKSKIFTVLNNASSPQFLHLFFLFFPPGHLKRQIPSSALAVSNKSGIFSLKNISALLLPISRLK